MKRLLILAGVIAIAVASMLPLRAQDKAPNPEPAGKTVFLKAEIVFNEFDGEKKVGSLPYTVFLDSTGRPATLRMNVRVPMNNQKGETSNQLIGTNIDCSARPSDGGLYAVSLTVSRSSLYFPDSDKDASGNAAGKTAQGQAQLGASAVPITRDFGFGGTLAMRDGQTSESTVATDPVSGHVIKVVVTLTVVK